MQFKNHQESEKKISQKSIDLKIKNIPHNIPKYERKEWKHWSDDDKDCQNTRHEVLIDESIIKVNFKDNQNCQVSTGEWLDPYTGYRVTDATKLDVDHMVPLKNAHDSGAWAWDKNRKSNYANYMQYQNHLIAVTASANRQKGAQGPEKWMPSNKIYWCEYSKNWIEIKVKWSLSATKSEWNALQRMQETCDVALNVTPIEEKQTIKTPVPDTPIENNQSSGSQNIQISSLNCKGKPEILEIFNQSDSHQNMTMWSIIDDGSKHTFNFPAGYLLGPQMSVQIVSGAMGENTQSIIYWKKQNVWNNNGDTATILDSKGNVVVKMDCP